MARGGEVCTDLGDLTGDDLPRAGGKAVALDSLARGELTVPGGLCVATGDRLTVDGFLGVVLIANNPSPRGTT